MKDIRIEVLDDIEAVRKRPEMYVGSKALFGFINYLVCPVSLLLAYKARRINVIVSDVYQISADVPIKAEHSDLGVAPFQRIQPLGEGHGYEGTVLNALSQELYVAISASSSKKEWHFVRGKLISHKEAPVQAGDSETILQFTPDSSIFTVLQISPAIFASYFRRLSLLHKGVHFSITAGDAKQEYFAANGIVDMFQHIAAPYQLMLEPIQFVGKKDELILECVMAYHSWSEDHLCCFINNGRAVQGGTHERGIFNGIKRLKKKLDLPEQVDNGLILVASIHYPNVI